MKTRQMMLRFFSVILGLICTVTVFAQGNITVKGLVLDDLGEPLPGANVAVVNKKLAATGTATDINGEFKLTVNLERGDEKLVVSFMGMKNEIVKITSKIGAKSLTIRMKTDETLLQEVVVVEDGYSQLPRKDMVGAFTTVKADDVMMPAMQSIDQMLQGKIPGMIVSNTSARVGATPKITIRGTSTILGQQSPLWVVDGVIQEEPLNIDAAAMATGDMRELIGNEISWLNPQDIDKITVLKDASATAIYGSRASNGVIVVTTKKGTPGRASVNYSNNISVRQRPNYGLYDFMNSQERILFSQEAYQAGMRYDREPLPQIYTYEGLMAMFNKRMITEEEFAYHMQRLETVNTDWFKLLTRNAVSHSHNLSLSGGSEKFTYNASVGYSNNKGMEVGNQNDQLTSRLSINTEIGERLRLSFQMNGSVRNSYGYGAGVNPYSYALNASRAMPAFEENGDRAFYGNYYNYQYNTLLGGKNVYNYNIFNEMDNSYSKNQAINSNASLNINLKILDWLSYQGTGSMSQNTNKGEAYTGEKTSRVEQLYRGYPYGSEKPGSDRYRAALMPFGGELGQSNMLTRSFSMSHRLVFGKQFNEDHRINAMLGMEMRSSKGSNSSNTVWGFVPERGEIIVSPTLPEDFKPIGAETPLGWGALSRLYNGGAWRKTSTTTNYLSFFGTFAYSLMDRYVINMNVRSDASNRFGQDVNQQFDPTWSFGLQWRVAQEKFIKDNITWLDQLNLRATYGIQGNVVNSISPEMSLIYQGILKGYEEYYLNIASIPNPYLDWERTKSWNLGLDFSLFGVSVNAEYYGRRSNAIINQDVAYEYGIKSMPLNGGIINNHGIEVSLHFTPIRTDDIALSIGMNASKNWNISYTDDRTAKADELTHTEFLTGNSSRPIKKGYPLSAFWSYQFTGLSHTNGYPTFAHTSYEDMGGDGSVDPTTFLVYSGQSEPYFTGGLNPRFRWKGLNIGMDFSLLIGAQKRLFNPYSTFSQGKMPDITKNLSKELNNRWKKPGDEAHTNIPALYTSVNDLYNLYLPNGRHDNIYSMWANSDERVANASFLRCNQLSVSYTFPTNWVKKIGLSRIALNANMNNLFVIASKKWKGFDPELGNSIQPRIYSVGLSIGL